MSEGFITFLRDIKWFIVSIIVVLLFLMAPEINRLIVKIESMIAENQKDVLEHTHEDGFTHSHFGAVNHTHKAIDKSPPIALWCGSGGENHGESLSYFFTSKILFIWKRDEKISQVTDFTEVVDEVTNSTVFESVDFKAPDFLTESPKKITFISKATLVNNLKYSSVVGKFILFRDTLELQFIEDEKYDYLKKEFVPLKTTFQCKISKRDEIINYIDSHNKSLKADNKL